MSASVRAFGSGAFRASSHLTLLSILSMLVDTGSTSKQNSIWEDSEYDASIVMGSV